MACAALAAGASALAQGAWQYDVDAGLTYERNVNRAYAPADIRADAGFTLDDVTDAGTLPVHWTIALRREAKIRRAPAADGRGDGY